MENEKKIFSTCIPASDGPRLLQTDISHCIFIGNAVFIVEFI